MGKYISSHGKSNNFRSENQIGYSDNHTMNISYMSSSLFSAALGAPVAQWVKRWPTDLADRVRSSLEVKSSQP